MEELFKKLFELKKKLQCEIEVRTKPTDKYGETVVVTLRRGEEMICRRFLMDLDPLDDNYIEVVLTNMAEELKEEYQ